MIMRRSLTRIKTRAPWQRSGFSVFGGIRESRCAGPQSRAQAQARHCTAHTWWRHSLVLVTSPLASLPSFQSRLYTTSAWDLAQRSSVNLKFTSNYNQLITCQVSQVSEFWYANFSRTPKVPENIFFTYFFTYIIFWNIRCILFLIFAKLAF